MNALSELITIQLAAIALAWAPIGAMVVILYHTISDRRSDDPVTAVLWVLGWPMVVMVVVVTTVVELVKALAGR